MGRAMRSEQQTGWHHVMNRGVARQVVFFDVADRVEFGRLLGVAADRHGVEVHAYCLMPNHFHLVVRCPAGGLSTFVQLVVAVFTRHVNERAGRDGPLFRGRFRSRPIGDMQYVRTAVRYVHRNPLALPGVDTVEGFRWSSHRTYLRMRRTPPWLRTDTVLDLFDHQLDRFHAFVSRSDERLPDRVDADRLDAAVWMAIEEAAADIERAPQGLARTVTELAFELIEPGRSTQAAQRARRQARVHPILVEAAERALVLAA